MTMQNIGVQRMAWPLLCTLPKGRAWKNWNPYPPIRMLHAIGVCIATFVDGMPFPTSPCFLIRTIPKEVFQASLVKCEIKANASAKSDFSPIRLQIYTIISNCKRKMIKSLSFCCKLVTS